jgi:hypothetical protein
MFFWLNFFFFFIKYNYYLSFRLRLVREIKFPIPFPNEIIPYSVNLHILFLYEILFYFSHFKF